MAPAERLRVYYVRRDSAVQPDTAKQNHHEQSDEQTDCALNGGAVTSSTHEPKRLFVTLRIPASSLRRFLSSDNDRAAEASSTDTDSDVCVPVQRWKGLAAENIPPSWRGRPKQLCASTKRSATSETNLVGVQRKRQRVSGWGAEDSLWSTIKGC